MPKIAYVNGLYRRHESAFVNIEDRGLQFADGVYEVIAFHDKKLIDLTDHLNRLEKSLSELSLHKPKTNTSLRLIIDQIIKRNRISSGSVYKQVTRGVAPRDFSYSSTLKPTLIVYAKRSQPFTIKSIQKRHIVISKPDIRWRRCDIKSVSLLPAVITKQSASEVGADETWMCDQEGLITEGTSSNAWIISYDKQLITRNLDFSILPGITRQRILKLARKLNIEIIERPFSINDVKTAKEAFYSSSTGPIKPVVKFNNHIIGDGKIGEITKLLIKSYMNYLDNFDVE